MKANELRIGNIVSWATDGLNSKGGLFVVEEINPKWVIIKSKHESGGSLTVRTDIASVVPVLLTEEWLVKFGFDGDINDGYGKENVTLGYVTTDDHFQMEYLTNLREWAVVDLQYVHSLQNLHFALTGEELTPNPTEK